MDLINLELEIPKKLLESTSRQNCFVTIAHKSWLKSLYKNGVLSPFKDFEWPHKWDQLGRGYTKIFIWIHRKNNASVIPLPRPQHSTNETDLTFLQLLHYVHQTNHRNLWKEAFKQYSPSTHQKSDLTLTSYNQILREVLIRSYGCPIVSFIDPSQNVTNSKQFESHPNLHAALFCVETSTAFYTFHLFAEHTLHDCLTYSPAILDQNYKKLLFIVFQLLSVLRSMHDRGLTIGEIGLDDIFIDEHLWIQIMPQLESNLIVRSEISKTVTSSACNSPKSVVTSPECIKNIHKYENGRCLYCMVKNYDKIKMENQSIPLEQLCKLWINGQISNFTYLSEINKMAGRKYGEPNCHYIFPWVTDFTSRCGNNWRDLTKSKYRLNKGDRQLDFTYSQQQGSLPPHHVSDILSSITYYVYMARRTPKSILCKNVRAIWVPAEYPNSIQRLQEWTPDECIPEFFSKPTVFKSIHEDLIDLQVPRWSSSPEDFVEKHREALESAYVSERLNHWIDLTFGYKLSGPAAIKSKNVLLQLVDNHQTLTNCGVVQLFYVPHPPRQTYLSPWFGRVPPKIQFKQSRNDIDEDEEQSTTLCSEMDHSPKSGKMTILPQKQMSGDDKKTSFQSYVTPQGQPNKLLGKIILPKEYNPIANLNTIESQAHFQSKTFNTNHKTDPIASSDEVNPTSHKQAVASKRIRELQILGCLIIEIFMSKQLRPLLTGSKSLEQRLSACLKVIKSEPIPICIKYVIELLLPPSIETNARYVTITNNGLPPPSAHQLLQSMLQIIPFPQNFWKVYKFLDIQKQFDLILIESEIEEIQNVLVLINETNIKISGNLIIHDDLIISRVVNLIENDYCGVMAAWFLFDPIGQILGPDLTYQRLLQPILKLYTDFENVKICKLYHHWFLLRLIVRFGLKVFLEHFITPLVEAVGGYRDYQLKNFNHDFNRLLSNDEDEPEDEITEDVATENDDETIFVFDDATGDEDETELSQITNESPALMDLQNEETSSEIASPVTQQNNELLIINCEVGSKKSTDESVPPKPQSLNESNEESTSKISDISSDSIIWLSHRLGPVLTAKYLSRNLLRMLTLCYVGKENLDVCESFGKSNVDETVDEFRLSGDLNATQVLNCLGAIAALYGEQLIILQYIPHITELIVLCKRRLTPNLEGGLISCIVLLKYIIPYLTDETLSSNLQDILKLIIIPSIRLIGTTKTTFPNGVQGRNALCYKLVECFLFLIRRCGDNGLVTSPEIFLPGLQRFFLIFDKIFSEGQVNEDVESIKSSSSSSNFVEVCRDGTTTEWSVKDGRPQRVGPDAESWSPPSSLKTHESNQSAAFMELKEVFTPELAYKSFVPLYRMGDSNFSQSIKNINLVQDLCHEYEKTMPEIQSIDSAPPITGSTGSFGTTMIGNRIQSEPSPSGIPNTCYMTNQSRHLRGNWLAYWEHEIGRSDSKFNFKQIKLQTFSGHFGSVRSTYVFDNENSFMSGSRDKTVKLWSLRSQGDGTTVSQPQLSYCGHKKSVLSITFLEALRVAVSTDSVVHIWDPFMNSTLHVLDGSSISLLKPMPAPSPTLLAATTDGTVKVIDGRLQHYAQEYKVQIGPPSLIRCMAVSPNGNTFAVGQSTGTLSLLDLRSGGVLIASWRAHEGELLQLTMISNTLISSSLDQTISVWQLSDGKFKFHLKGGGVNEPVHLLSSYNNSELVYGTTANRIGCFSDIAETGGFSSGRLRSETFKGVLTSMSVLPLNKLLLLGSDTGNISLLC